MGIAQVSSMKSQFINFVRVNPNFISQSFNLKIGGLLGHKGYWAENNKLFFVNMDKINSNDNVLIKMVVALDNIDPYEDELGIPPEIAEQIVQTVFEKYVAMQVNLPEDKINNNKKPVAGGS